MNLKRLKIGMFIALFIGMCILPATAIKINDIDYVLSYPGGYRRTSDFYAQRYDILYINVQASGSINIQVRYADGSTVNSWNGMSGVVNLHFAIPEDASYYVYLENAGDDEISVVGVMYLNEEITATTTTTTTKTTIPVYIDADVALIFLTAIYGVAGVLFVISIFVYNRRKNPHFTFLSWFDDDELLPVGWQPSDEDEI